MIKPDIPPFALAAALLLSIVVWGLSPAGAPAFDNTHLLEDARNNDREAQYTLAHLYLKGQGGIPYDVEEAIKLLEQAAETGHQMAAFDLGLLFLEGTRVSKDRTKALNWFTRSAEMGQVDAQYFLGLAYRESDTSQSLMWLNRAAMGGHAAAAAEREKICRQADLCED